MSHSMFFYAVLGVTFAMAWLDTRDNTGVAIRARGERGIVLLAKFLFISVFWLPLFIFLAAFTVGKKLPSTSKTLYRWLFHPR